MTTLAAVAERTSELEKVVYELTTTMHGLAQHTVSIARTVDGLRQEMERFVREVHSSYERLQTQQSALSATIATLHEQYVHEMAALRREAEARDRAYREEMAAIRRDAGEWNRQLATQLAEMAAQFRQNEAAAAASRECYDQEMAALRRDAEARNRQLATQLAEMAAQFRQNEAAAAASRERYDQEVAAIRHAAEAHERAYREEVAAIRREAEADYKKMRVALAQQSLKMGTLAEDLVAPSIPRILAEVVKCPSPPQMLGVRIRKRLPNGRSQEYDVIAVCDDVLLINETKSRLQTKDVTDFIQKLRTARDFLPEYGDKKIIGALASFYIDPSIVRFGERRGLIMLGVVDGLMEILNREGFVPTTY